MAEKYLDSFLIELGGYAERIGALASLLFAGAAEEVVGPAAQELSRLFHTIAGLSGSLGVKDFSGPAEGLEYIFASVSAQPRDPQVTSAIPALTELLNLTARYLKRRLAAMSASGQFTTPAPDDEEARQALDEAAWRLGNLLNLQGKELPASNDALSEADLAILRAFSESDLAEAANAPYPPALNAAESAAAPDQVPAPEAAASPTRTGGHPAAFQQPHLVESMEVGGQDAYQQSADDEIPPEMLRLFQMETQEDLQAFQTALAHLETPKDRTAAILEMRHIAHKIKGAAATVNLQTIANLSHCLEDMLDLLRSRRLHYIPAVLEALVHGVTELEAALRRHAAGEPESSEGLERLRAEYEALLATGGLDQNDDPSATQPDSRRLAAAARQQASDTLAESAAADLSDTSPDTLREQHPWVLGREHSLRVEVSRLDQLMGLVGELATNRANTEQVRRDINESLSEMRGTIQRLGQLIEQLDEEETIRSEQQRLLAGQVPGPALVHTTIVQERPAQNQRADWPETMSLPLAGTTSRPLTITPDPASEQTDKRAALGLERFDSEHSHLISAFREGINDVATLGESLQSLLLRLNGLFETQETLTTTIQRDITHLRLVPISQMLPRLQLTARMVAQEQNKQINFQASGEATEIDRDIIEAISGPLGQLVRNCAAHGIESVEERREQGKPEVGTISLRAYYSGNEVSIEVSDDGRGINYHQLVAAALASGKLSPEESARLAPEQAVNLMLLPDISTSPEVTTIAGRGVGMDMVRKAVESLKGALHIHSKPGEGTTFHLRLPISLGILHALFVRAGQRTYAVPLMTVERIVRGQDLPQQRERISFYTLSELLGEMASPPDPLSTGGEGRGEAGATPSSGQAALIIALGHRQIGIVVDEVLAEREIVIKRLSPYLRRRGVRGVTMSPTGELLLLLDLPELAHHAPGGAPAAQEPAISEPLPLPGEDGAGAAVLVVDDSLFMRRTLEAQLTRAGYQVAVAKDGLEALHYLLKHRARLVLLDIEMPRLDGYELLNILRSRAQFKTLPVVMLTSRAAEQHRAHALELGANAYLVKPCPQDMLLQIVASLVNV